MAKRGKLEIMKDILEVIRKNHNSIRVTPLIRKSNLSTQRFKEYYNELKNKGFIIEDSEDSGNKTLSLSEKGFKFLDKYRTIVSFIEEFEL